MYWLQAFILGAVQGISEFLPISSTAHLIIVEHWFKLDQATYGLSFDMVTNLGTTVALIAVFWPDLVRYFSPKGLLKPSLPEHHLARTILIVTGIVGIVGVLAEEQIATSLRTLPVIAVSLVAVGILMLWAERIITTRVQATTTDVYKIGLSQMIAFIPGVSRSGITMTTGMFSGLPRASAARLSFILSVPITVAAIVKRLLSFAITISHEGISPSVAWFYLIGAVTAGIVGFLTLRYLLSFLQKHSLAVFAYYRFALAGVLILSIILGR